MRLIFIFIFAVIFRCPAYAEILIRPAQMPDSEYQNLVNQNKDNQSLTNFYLRERQTWNQQFDNLVEVMSLQNPKDFYEMIEFRNFLNHYILTAAMKKRLEAKFGETFFNSNLSSESQDITFNELDTVIINGEKIIGTKTVIKSEDFYQIVILNDQYPPQFFSGKGQFFKKMQLTTLAESPCDSMNKEYEEFSIAGHELCGLNSIANSTDSSNSYWKYVLAGGLLGVLGVYLAGYEVVFLGF